MAAKNLATLGELQQKYETKQCVFISYRLADADVARTVSTFLMDTADTNVYCSENDARLKEAISGGDDERIAESIDASLKVCTRLLGIINNRTKGSWWVPYEFGATRCGSKPVSILLLEEVKELPSYMKVATVLRDSDDLLKWARKSSPDVYKLAQVPVPPIIPRVPVYRVNMPEFR